MPVPVLYTENWADTFGSQSHPDVAGGAQAYIAPPEVASGTLIGADIDLVMVVNAGITSYTVDWNDRPGYETGAGTFSHTFDRNGSFFITIWDTARSDSLTRLKVRCTAYDSNDSGPGGVLSLEAVQVTAAPDPTCPWTSFTTHAQLNGYVKDNNLAVEDWAPKTKAQKKEYLRDAYPELCV